ARPALATETVFRGDCVAAVWAGARQGDAALAAEIAAFRCFDAATWTLQGPAPPRIYSDQYRRIIHQKGRLPRLPRSRAYWRHTPNRHICIDTDALLAGAGETCGTPG